VLLRSATAGWSKTARPNPLEAARAAPAPHPGGGDASARWRVVCGGPASSGVDTRAAAVAVPERAQGFSAATEPLDGDLPRPASNCERLCCPSWARPLQAQEWLAQPWPGLALIAPSRTAELPRLCELLGPWGRPAQRAAGVPRA